MATKKLLLFTAELPAHITRASEMPGFSHWSEPKNSPAQMQYRTIYFFAPNRTNAARQLTAIGYNKPCNLSEGSRNDRLIAAHHRAAFGIA